MHCGTRNEILLLPRFQNVSAARHLAFTPSGGPCAGQCAGQAHGIVGMRVHGVNRSFDESLLAGFCRRGRLLEVELSCMNFRHQTSYPKLKDWQYSYFVQCPFASLDAACPMQARYGTGYNPLSIPPRSITGCRGHDLTRLRCKYANVQMRSQLLAPIERPDHVHNIALPWHT